MAAADIRSNDEVKAGMRPLTQGALEELLKGVDGIHMIYFTAKWCGPCRSVKLDQIVKSAGNEVTWWLCDIDQNDYSAGYCRVKTIPAWMGIVNKVHTPILSTSDADRVITWLQALKGKFAEMAAGLNYS